MRTLTGAAKGLLTNLLRRTPDLVGYAVRAASSLSPQLKIPLLMKIMGFLQRSLPQNTPVTTNLGINSHLRIQLTTSHCTTLLFGTPNQYRGERGALYLSKVLASDCSAFVDVGANHGYFTTFIADAMDQSFPVYFFAPNEVLFREISRNLQSNGFKNVKGFPIAIGAKSGTSKFHLNLSDDSSSSLSDYFKSRHQTREVDVQIMTISDFIGQEAVKDILLKVDIASAEFEFLHGAISESKQIKYLIIEVLGPAIQGGFIKSAISRLGMHAYYINDFSLEHSATGGFVYKEPEYNWLLCRLDPYALSRKLENTRFQVVASDLERPRHAA